MVLLTVWGCNPIMCSKSKQRKPFFSLKKTKQKKTVCLKKCLNYSQVKLITFFPQKSLSKINTPGKCIYFNLLASHILDTLLVFHIQRHFKNTVSGVLYSAFYHNSFFFHLTFIPLVPVSLGCCNKESQTGWGETGKCIPSLFQRLEV